MDWRMMSALGMALGLAGCSLLSSDQQQPKPSWSSESVKTPSSRAPGGSSPAPPPNKPSKLDKPAPMPEELLGLDEVAVHQLLGEPAATRSEGGMRILSYQGKGDCALKVMLFLDVKVGDVQVLSYQLGSAPLRPTAAQACYAALRGSR